MVCEYPKKRRRSAQTSPTPNAFASQDPAWSIGELSLDTNSPQHVMLDNDALSCYSSSSETFSQHMSSYGLGHDHLPPLEINYEQLSPLMQPNSGGLISPDMDTFDMNQPFPPQPHHAMDIHLGSMGDVNSSSINWLPTAFSEEIDYAALSGIGVPLKTPNDKSAGLQGDGTALPMEFFPASPPNGRRGSHSPISTGSDNSSTKGNGRYYSTSFDGARIPFVRGTKRRRSFNVSSTEPTRSSLFRQQTGVFQFPEISVPIDSLPPVQVTGPAMDLKAYDRIADAFRQVCHGLGTTFPPFKTLAVPSPAHLNYFLQLYYEHFHPILPMLHLRTLVLNEDEWVLGLAAAAIGCRYSDSDELLGFVRPMTEFLRRVVMLSV